MDIEQLKLILETLSGLGQETKTILYWYLGFSLVRSILTGAFLLCVVWMVGRVILKMREPPDPEGTRGQVLSQALFHWYLYSSNTDSRREAYRQVRDILKEHGVGPRD